MKFAALISFFLLLAWAPFAQDSVRTLAGAPLQTGTQDGASAEARFNDPAAIAANTSGNLYLADSRNNLIRRISPNGAVTTLVTSGPLFDTPSGIAVAPQGIVVSDTGNHVIRRINPDGSTIILAGSPGQSGFADGIGAAARFDSPLGLAIAGSGIIYVADCGNHTIRAIAPGGAVTTVAGSPGQWGSTDGQGVAARFNGPVGLALDSAGNLFISDSNNHTVRKLAPNQDVTTLAGIALSNGFVDGDRAHAKFFQPAELALDPHGAIYIADSMNHAIRKSSPDGKVSTVTGFLKAPGSEDGDNARARLYNPYGLAFLPSGELAFSDSYNQTIRCALPPSELAIAIAGAISWNSVIGKTYQIQISTPSLHIWRNFADPLTAIDLTSRANVPLTATPQLFRLLVQP
jgi:sugar lactone lactonase YvrE